MRRVQLEPQVPQVPQGLLELQARLVLLVQRVLLGLQVQLVLLGLQVQLVLQARQVRQVRRLQARQE